MALFAANTGVGLSGADPTEIAPTGDRRIVNRLIPGNQSPAHVPAAFVPRPAPLSVVHPGNELGTHFSGLNFRNQRVDADGGNQFNLEPPDQGLCVGNGYVLEAVNSVLAVYNASTGAQIGGFESMNQFFIGDHQVDRTVNPVTFGTFIADPSCRYDAGSGRFFMTVTTIGLDPSTGAFTTPFTLRIATSKTSTPTVSPSDWYFTTIDVTNDGSNGTPSHPGCPCLGDQPLLGADANGVYVTTNEFPFFTNGFNGAQIYALQKSALVGGTTPHIQRIEGAPIASSNYGVGIPYSLQPAVSPSASDFASGSNGTEYLLGALEFGKRPFALDDRIAVWALTNTSSLNSTPAIAVSNVVIGTQVYGLPGAIVQPNGPTPLADALKQHENLIDGDDDRMQTAVYAHGLLWGAGVTVVKTPNGSSQVGVTYYVVTPTISSGSVTGASVVKQGYLSVNDNSVTYPSLGVTSSGKAVIGVTLVGPHYYPSAAYATLDDTLGTAPSSLRLVASGAVPADGFTGYPFFGNSGIERWGDYGAASAVGNDVWIGNEWIQGNVGFPPLFANWNTFLSKVTP